MNDYATSLEKINVRDDTLDEILTKEEMKIYGRYVGKFSWLAFNTRIDLLVYDMILAGRKKKVALKDLKNVYRILKKLEQKENKAIFRRVYRKENLCVI